ncbi:MAG TPA: hypothetical protein DD411_06280 [Alcanivorax sp.]|jgi:plasmid maintenance system antidote protein VapI|nr:hypothetical protein [Alcanivorax sp.]|tara:strand:- start:291 stop:578 length:288 start_codon:yes stop_codon:yes gene_type:complete
MEIYKTVELCDRVKSLIGKTSRYALAKYLGVTLQTVTTWYEGRTVMNDDTALKVAGALNLDPEMVLISLQLERIEKKGNDILSQHWRHIAEQIAA